jgi:hypothetical protein
MCVMSARSWCLMCVMSSSSVWFVSCQPDLSDVCHAGQILTLWFSLQITSYSIQKWEILYVWLSRARRHLIPSVVYLCKINTIPILMHQSVFRLMKSCHLQLPIDSRFQIYISIDIISYKLLLIVLKFYWWIVAIPSVSVMTRTLLYVYMKVKVVTRYTVFHTFRRPPLTRRSTHCYVAM